MRYSGSFYGVKHKDETIRGLSRSGGVFTALTDVILAQGGVVYGVALTDDFLAEHRRAITKEERDQFRGSKYIQSDIGDSYRHVREDLRAGLPVLFSGTPCQIDGLTRYLQLERVDMEKLITVDIVCHGVPSPKVWQDFLKWKSGGGNIQAVDFRDKQYGWRDHRETIIVDGKIMSSREYTKLFFSHLTLRPACFQCPYKQVTRVGDITIGDYWRIEKIDKAYDDDKGISLVSINSDKGDELFKKCMNHLTVREYPKALSIQPALRENYAPPANRCQFWKDYETLSFDEIVCKYITPTTQEEKVSLQQRILRKVKHSVKKLAKRVLYGSAN